MKLCSGCGRLFEQAGYRCPFCSYEPPRLDGRLAFAPEMADESEGFEAGFFPRLAEVESGSFWFRSRNRILIWALRRYFPKAENLLEIGCGTGFVLRGIREAFPELTLCGSEIFAAGLCFAAQRLPGVELFQMDARRIPFKEEFDVIGAFDVLEHIEDDELVLSELYQAIRKGGGILLTVPQHSFLWSKTDEYSRHFRRYSRRELKAKVEKAGFQVMRTTSFVSLLLPLMLISRLKPAPRQEFDPRAEFELSGPVNFLLERLMDLERALITIGLSFPAGGSLLLVARRS
jgi:SAM-dependent methyltransferase